MDFSLDFSGLADIARDLETLSRAENNKVLRDATRAGAEVMRDAVVERAPERTGKLKKNVEFSLSVQSVGGKLSRVSTFVDGTCEPETVITA